MTTTETQQWLTRPVADLPPSKRTESALHIFFRALPVGEAVFVAFGDKSKRTIQNGTRSNLANFFKDRAVHSRLDNEAGSVWFFIAKALGQEAAS